MEVDKIQRQVSKFQRVSSNGSTTTTDIPSNRGDFNHVDDDAAAAAAGSRLCGWPSSRIVRVSRASGGKDRHSKVLTSKGLRDRRVRLSVSTAIQFYDLQDRLGFDQPSKAVEWLLKAASSSIDELPSLDPPFPGVFSGEKKNQEIVSQAKSPAYSSTSETSKGSGLSLSRSENRNKARERAREMASKKDKTRVRVLNQVNSMPENSPSFTDLLTGGISTTSRSHMDYFYTAGDSYNYVPAVTTTTGGGETYQLNFAMTSSSTGGGFSRGTLQSNLQSSLLPHHHHQHLQSSSIDGSTSANLPFFAVDHYPATGGYHLNYGGEAGGRRSDHHHKGKSKN